MENNNNIQNDIQEIKNKKNNVYHIEDYHPTNNKYEDMDNIEITKKNHLIANDHMNILEMDNNSEKVTSVKRKYQS